MKLGRLSNHVHLVSYEKGESFSRSYFRYQLCGTTIDVWSVLFTKLSRHRSKKLMRIERSRHSCWYFMVRWKSVGYWRWIPCCIWMIREKIVVTCSHHDLEIGRLIRLIDHRLNDPSPSIDKPRLKCPNTIIEAQLFDHTRARERNLPSSVHTYSLCRWRCFDLF